MANTWAMDCCNTRDKDRAAARRFATALGCSVYYTKHPHPSYDFTLISASDYTIGYLAVACREEPSDAYPYLFLPAGKAMACSRLAGRHGMPFFLAVSFPNNWTGYRIISETELENALYELFPQPDDKLGKGKTLMIAVADLVFLHV